jgi:hypothetical protein
LLGNYGMGDGSLGNVNVGLRGDGSHASFSRNMAAWCNGFYFILPIRKEIPK